MGFWKRLREEFNKGISEPEVAARPRQQIEVRPIPVATRPRRAAARLSPTQAIPAKLTPSATPVAARRPTKDIEVVGESYYPSAFSRMFFDAKRPLGGQLNRTATLIAEPENPHDENAVAVYAERRLVGYVPAELARDIQRLVMAERARGRDFTVDARIWASSEDGTWRARVTLLFAGVSEPEWAYVDTATWPGDRSPDGSQRLTWRGLRARSGRVQAASMVDGRHFDLLREDIRQAKKTGNSDEALRLVSLCLDAAEKVAAINCDRPIVWPTEQAAIIYRSLKDYAAEVAVLQRFIDADPEGMGTQKIRDRLNRAQELMHGL